MSDVGSTEKKQALLKTLREGESIDATLQKTAEVILESTTESRDVSALLRECVEKAPDDSVMTADDWNHLTTSWQAHNDVGRNLARALTSGQSFAVSAQAATVTTGLALRGFSSSPFNIQWVRSCVRPAAQKLDSLLERRPLILEVQAALVRLRLNSSDAARRTPSQLLEDAKLALERPPASDFTPMIVLMPLREAIHTVLAALLRRRRLQEATRHDRDKVISIGKQCGRSELPAGHFLRVGDDVEALIAACSQAKPQTLARQEVGELLNNGLLLLKTLLESLDENALRP